MTTGAAEKDSVQPSSAPADYEVLRRAALGEALAPEARNGLALFLRRGMWGWARGLASANAATQSLRSPPSMPATPSEHGAIIYVFAAMAMNIHDRRAR